MNTSDKERIKKIIQKWEHLQSKINEKNITESEVKNDQFIQWAITTPLYNIGEQVYKLSPEIKKQYPDLPWIQVAGLRHRLVHDYDNTNWSIISKILFLNMPQFIKQLEEIANKEE